MTLLKPVNRRGLVPWGIARDLEDDFSRLWSDIGRGFNASDGDFVPALDVREDDGSYIIEADLPGMKKDDVHLEISENVVTIRGERTKEEEKKEKDYHRVERSYGSFRRSVSIPGGFQHSGVSAEFEDGVLKVTLPKPEESKPRRIDVK